LSGRFRFPAEAVRHLDLACPGRRAPELHQLAQRRDPHHHDSDRPHELAADANALSDRRRA